MLRKIAVLATLIALVVAVLPTAGALAAGGSNEQLEKKWDQLVTNFNRQNMDHAKAHKWVEAWLAKNPKAADKAEVEKHLNICNTALTTAHAIVARHEGFNANGKVVKPNLAYQSIKELANVLRLHASSVKNIVGHIK